jgi:hypothetical protein
MKAFHCSIIHLRILVLLLGEMQPAGWWNSQFLSKVGISFLERVYPKTNFAAAIQSATQVAKVVHDQVIGKGDVYHLFRLTPRLEREISKELLENSSQIEKRYADILHDKDALLITLQQIAGDVQVSDLVGPVQLSVAANQLSSNMVALYHYAFQEGKQIYPYFEEALTS